MNNHTLKEYKDTGLFYCIICNKAEIELQEPCLPKKVE